jgi:hypothetical protein
LLLPRDRFAACPALAAIVPPSFHAFSASHTLISGNRREIDRVESLMFGNSRSSSSGGTQGLA